MKKVCLLTLGCKKNLADSERLLYKLESEYQFTENASQADVVIINTCGFIDSAKQENMEVIGEYHKLKNNQKIEKLIVFGCLAQLYASDVEKAFPQVDKVFGANNIEDIAEYLLLKNEDISDKRSYLTPPPSAYLKISEGCNQKCSFCAIPVIRGKQKSVQMEKVIDEAKYIKDLGYKELILIAQDTSHYGTDIYNTSKLDELMEKVSDINFDWIRLMYAYPTSFPERVLHVMAERENICKYIDIPLQHISDAILKSMKRGIDKLGTIKLIEKMKSIIPNLAIRSTFIVGYPNESREEFEDLLKFIKDAELDRVGAFTYSPQRFTSSYNLVDNISQEEKDARLSEFMLVQQKVSLMRNKRLVGKSIKVLIDGENDEFLLGRSQHDAPEIDNEILIPKSKFYKVGEFYNFLIKDYNEYQLFT